MTPSRSKAYSLILKGPQSGWRILLHFTAGGGRFTCLAPTGSQCPSSQLAVCSGAEMWALGCTSLQSCHPSLMQGDKARVKHGNHALPT